MSSDPKKNDEKQEVGEGASYAAAAGALGMTKEQAARTRKAAERLEADELDELALQRELEELREEANKSKDKMMRAMAELDNMQRIAQRDISNAHRYALERFSKELLPVLDSLERGMEAVVGEEVSLAGVREGVELTYKMFLDVLEKFGVTQVNPEGEMFDPEHHEAMSTQVSAEAAANQILFVVQKGYLLHQRLIRPARVIIAKNEA